MKQKELELEFLIVGEAAEAVNGKLYMMGGGWNQIQSAAFPTIARCGIAVAVSVHTKERREIPVRVVYSNDPKQDEKNQNVLSLELQGLLTSGVPLPGMTLPDVQRVMLVVNGNFPVPSAGKYRIEVFLPDGESKSVVFEALQIAASIVN
jgi:hypothetical protein